MTDYSNEPKSLATARAERAGNCSLWTPRDAVIDVLRRIDRGEIKPSRVIIAYREGEPSEPVTSYTLAGADVLQHVGMLERVKQMLLADT